MLPKTLIAIESCHQYRPRAIAQRQTWAAEVEGADLRFFLGLRRGLCNFPMGEDKYCIKDEGRCTGDHQWTGFVHDDEILLNVEDGYLGLPAKTRGICKWALDHEYDFLFKCDDDVYVQPERLLSSDFAKHDYRGRLRGPSGIFPAPYCSGFGYWLSRKAMQAVAEAEPNGHDSEDRFVGNAVHAAGLQATREPRFVVISSQRSSISGQEGPRAGNDIAVACEFTPETMHEVHRQWLNTPSGIKSSPLHSGELSRVSILIKTFLRDGCLFRCVEGIRTCMPEARLVIVDDGLDGIPTRSKVTLYEGLRAQGHHCIWLPYDSGFGAKSNAAIPHFDREYVLIGSDDFEFGAAGVRAGIEKLVKVLDADRSIHIVSGRVNGRPYESCLEQGPDWVREIPGHRETRRTAGLTYKVCDLTVNFSLIRTSCFGPGKLHWDGGEVKIGGGEHGAFFLDAKRLGYGVAVVEDVVIHEMPQDFSNIHPMYPQMRARARQPGRPCLRARGIQKWGLQGGNWEDC